MVPLIVSAPGHAPGRSESYVGLADIAPTVLELAEVETTAVFEGRSLGTISPDLEDPTGQVGVSELSWQENLRSVMTDEWHLILNLDDPAARKTALFVGDSPNDEPAFQFFENAVGVANVRDFAETMAHLPAYVTDARGGSGFAVLAERILYAARGGARTP